MPTADGSRRLNYKVSPPIQQNVLSTSVKSESGAYNLQDRCAGENIGASRLETHWETYSWITFDLQLDRYGTTVPDKTTGNWYQYHTSSSQITELLENRSSGPDRSDGADLALSVIVFCVLFTIDIYCRCTEAK